MNSLFIKISFAIAIFSSCINLSYADANQSVHVLTKKFLETLDGWTFYSMCDSTNANRCVTYATKRGEKEVVLKKWLPCPDGVQKIGKNTFEIFKAVGPGQVSAWFFSPGHKVKNYHWVIGISGHCGIVATARYSANSVLFYNINTGRLLKNVRIDGVDGNLITSTPYVKFKNNSAIINYYSYSRRTREKLVVNIPNTKCDY